MKKTKKMMIKRKRKRTRTGRAALGRLMEAIISMTSMKKMMMTKMMRTMIPTIATQCRGSR
jgi:hypothetical protein